MTPWDAADPRSPWPRERRRAASWLAPDPALDADPVAAVRATVADSLTDTSRLRRLAHDPSPHVRWLARRRLAGAPSLLGERPIGWMERRRAERATGESSGVSEDAPPKLPSGARSRRAG